MFGKAWGQVGDRLGWVWDKDEDETEPAQNCRVLAGCQELYGSIFTFLSGLSIQINLMNSTRSN